MRLHLIGLAMAAFSAVPAAAEAPRTSASDVDAIRAVGRKWADLYASGRFAEIPDLYTTDTEVMPRGRPRIVGREAMRRAIGGLAAGRKVDIAITEHEVRAVGDYGWYVGDFHVTYTSAAGTAPVSENARSLIIYRRDADGQWRVLRDIDSPAPAPAIAAASASSPVALPPGSFDAPPRWDPKSRTVAVACDRLAANRYDRDRLAPGVARAAIDVPAAIAVCEADLARLPGDPRLLFQLARLYGYAGDKAKTLAARQVAASAGNLNAIFLLGYLDFEAAGDDATRCAAARRMKLAADRGNYSAQLTYAADLVEGRLAACADRATVGEAAAYVAAARPAADGFFETRLADHLGTDLAGHMASAARTRLSQQMAGTWRGTFRRYDASGALVETVPSEVRIAFDDGGHDYRQTNVVRRPDGGEERIETTGRWDGDRLRFANPRVDGWFGPLAGDTTGLSSVLQMTFKGDRPMVMSELLTVSPDGSHRMRVAQYVADGKIVRRTLIDETRDPVAAPAKLSATCGPGCGHRHNHGEQGEEL